MALAERLKSARVAAGITQAKAASDLRASTASVSAYEQGSRDVPDAVLEGLARIYGVHPAILRYGEDVLKIAATGEVERRLRVAANELARTADLIAQRYAADIETARLTAIEGLSGTEPANESPRQGKVREGRNTAHPPVDSTSGSERSTRR